MYPGLSHDEIIEECLKELKHHFEVGPEVALISAEKGVQCVPFDEYLCRLGLARPAAAESAGEAV